MSQIKKTKNKIVSLLWLGVICCLAPFKMAAMFKTNFIMQTAGKCFSSHIFNNQCKNITISDTKLYQYLRNIKKYPECFDKNGLPDKTKFFEGGSRNLLEEIVDVDEDGYNYELVEDLITKYGFDINTSASRFLKPLNYASRNGNLKYAELLVRHGAIIERYDIACAVRSGNLKLVKYLNKHNPSILMDKENASCFLMYAAEIINLPMIKYLVAHKALINATSPTPLNALLDRTRWADKDILPIVHYLLNQGAQPLPDSFGRQPTHKAAWRPSPEVIKVLVEKSQFNVNAVDDKNCTPIYHATERGNIDVVRYLLTKGAKQIPNKNGWYPLHKAQWERDLELTKLLFKADPSILTKKTKDGETPLFMAVDMGNVPSVKYLIDECKGDIHTTNNRGENLIYIAKKHGNFGYASCKKESKEILAFLNDKGLMSLWERFINWIS